MLCVECSGVVARKPSPLVTTELLALTPACERENREEEWRGSYAKFFYKACRGKHHGLFTACRI